MAEQKADVLILGAGPAGMAAALYASRAKLDTLLVERISPGGQMLWTHWVENYLGFPDGIQAFELVDKMAEHCRKFGIREMSGEALAINGDASSGFEVVFTGDDVVKCKAVIIATGASPKRLNVPGEVELTGKGVSYCATCDGAFFRAQDVAVIGGGDTAIEEALFLTRFAKKVYVIHRRDSLRATKILQERAFAHPKLEFVWDSVVEQVVGDDAVKTVRLLNRKTGAKTELALDGVFVFIGMDPNLSFLPDYVKRDEAGFILTDAWMKTSVAGMFAAGDCCSKPLRQIITAVSDGATAAFAVSHMLG